MPPMYGTLPSNSSHSRTPSDPLLQLQGYHTLSHHKRSPSSESGSHTSQLAASGNRGSIPSAIHLGETSFKTLVGKPFSWPSFLEKQLTVSLFLFRTVGAKLVIPPGEAPMLKSSSMDKSGGKHFTIDAASMNTYFENTEGCMMMYVTVYSEEASWTTTSGPSLGTRSW